MGCWVGSPVFAHRWAMRRTTAMAKRYKARKPRHHAPASANTNWLDSNAEGPSVRVVVLVMEVLEVTDVLVLLLVAVGVLVRELLEVVVLVLVTDVLVLLLVAVVVLVREVLEVLVLVVKEVLMVVVVIVSV